MTRFRIPLILVHSVDDLQYSRLGIVPKAIDLQIQLPWEQLQPLGDVWFFQF